MNHLNHIITNNTIIESAIKFYREIKTERQWQSMINHAQPFEDDATKTLKGFFNEQKEEAVQNLYGHKGFIKAIDADQSCDWEKWKVQFEEFEQLLLPEIFAEWGQEILNTITIGISFDIETPEIEEFIRNYSYKMAVNVNDTTKQQIQELFSKSLANGDSVQQIERKLRSLFTDISKVRANMIARSEVIRAHNAAADMSYIQSGVVEKKKWYTSADERRCRWCASLHGKEILVRETYFNQGDRFEITDADGKVHILKLDYSEIRYPPLHIRCRCTLIPIVFEVYR